MAPSSLGPRDYLEAMAAASRVLDSHASALDRLACDPSTDGNVGAERLGPGADMARTLEAATEAAGSASDLATICTAMVDGARAGCSTRCGRNLVTTLEGMAEVLRNADRVDSTRLALAFEAAAERFAATDTGADPGGFVAVLTVVADSALAASDAGADLGEVILQAADGGLEELERGPESNERLAARGVVDASAAGLLLVLDTLAGVVTGEPLPMPPEDHPPAEEAPPSFQTVHLYEISCRVEPPYLEVEAVVQLEDELVGCGDVLRFDVGASGWTITLRTTTAGAAVEVLAGHGRLSEVGIRVVHPAPEVLVAPEPAVAVGVG
jgi:dihydroxyacetone kinase-like predicted kinase